MSDNIRPSKSDTFPFGRLAATTYPFMPEGSRRSLRLPLGAAVRHMRIDEGTPTLSFITVRLAESAPAHFFRGMAQHGNHGWAEAVRREFLSTTNDFLSEEDKGFTPPCSHPSEIMIVDEDSSSSSLDFIESPSAGLHTPPATPTASSQGTPFGLTGVDRRRQATVPLRLPGKWLHTGTRSVLNEQPSTSKQADMFSSVRPPWKDTDEASLSLSGESLVEYSNLLQIRGEPCHGSASVSTSDEVSVSLQKLLRRTELK